MARKDKLFAHLIILTGALIEKLWADIHKELQRIVHETMYRSASMSNRPGNLKAQAN